MQILLPPGGKITVSGKASFLTAETDFTKADSKPTLTVCVIIFLGSEGAGKTPLQSMEPENVASEEIDDF